MTACKLDHVTPDSLLPEFLCRVCHPELNSTPEARRAADEADRKKRLAEQAENTRKRELARAEARLATLIRNGEPSEDTVSGKIAASMRKKIGRLTA